MARVTVEDCVLKIPNRFDLVMVAAQRARNISAGAAMTIDRDNDKNPVVALREIAEETVDIDELQESLIKGLQQHVEVEEREEEEKIDPLALQQGRDEAEEGAPPPMEKLSSMYEDADLSGKTEGDALPGDA